MEVNPHRAEARDELLLEGSALAEHAGRPGPAATNDAVVWQSERDTVRHVWGRRKANRRCTARARSEP